MDALHRVTDTSFELYDGVKKDVVNFTIQAAGAISTIKRCHCAFA